VTELIFSFSLSSFSALHISLSLSLLIYFSIFKLGRESNYQHSVGSLLGGFSIVMQVTMVYDHPSGNDANIFVMRYLIKITCLVIMILGYGR